MNSAQFNGFVDHPEQLNSQSLPLLTELVKEYPYFQTAQLLLAKNLSNEKNIRYAAQLKIAAAYASDRRKLYELINGLKTEEKPVQKQEVKTEPVKVPEIQIPAEKPPVEVKAVEVKPEISVEKQDAPVLKPTEELLKQYPVLKPEEEPVVEPIKEQALTEKRREKKTEPIVKKQPVSLDEKHTFTEWLKLASLHSISAKEIDRKKQAPKDDLIDKFLRDEPKISKPQKTEFFSPVNMAKQSVAEDNDLVSETLAVIYEKQGFYAKAIKAYEKLSLKYPEKKLSFAARIENLRQQLNEQ